MQFYSQYGQDQFLIEKVFKRKKDGIFIDIGAYDGVELSNTFFFEKELNWKGICIEPNPRVFEQLKKNRSCVSINCGVSDVSDTVEFISVSGWGIMLSGIFNFFDNRHIKRINQAITEHGGGKELIDISVLPLSHIFEQYNLKIIDYCSIDVEGGEMQVLKSIDFSKIQISVFTIENNNGTGIVMDFLKPLGYSLIARIGADEIYEKDSKRYFMILKCKIKLVKNLLSRFKKQILGREKQNVLNGRCRCK
jgi:FkbM family methyltransferase